MRSNRTRTSLAGRLLVAGAVGFVVFACFAPTQIVLRFKTNLQARAPQTAIQIGTESAYKQGAGDDGAIGELVVVPSGAHDALVDVSVALGVDGADPNACFTTPSNVRCVTAKRTYRFADHETRTFDIFLSSACLGVPCGPGQSCNVQNGTCTSIVENETDPPAPPPPPPSPPDASADTGVDATVPDAADAEPPVVSRCDAGFAALRPKSLALSDDHVYWVAPDNTVMRRNRNGGGATANVGTGTLVSAASGYGAWVNDTVLSIFQPSGVMNCAVLESLSAISARPASIFLSQNQKLRRVTAQTCFLESLIDAPPLTQIGVTTIGVYGLGAGGLGYTDINLGSTWKDLLDAPRPTHVTTTGNIAIVVGRDGPPTTTTTFYRFNDATSSPTPIVGIPGEPTITGFSADASSVYWITQVGSTAQLYRHALNPPAAVGAPIPFGAVASYVSAQHLAADAKCIYTWVSNAELQSPDAPGTIIGFTKPK